MVLKSFTERKLSRMSWTLVIMNHFWIALSISFNEHFTYQHTMLYLSGVVISGIIGFVCLARLKKLEGNIDLDQFHGHSFEHPKIALAFLLCCLGLAGFPITPSFIGEDIIFSHVHEDQPILAFIISLSFILDGLAIIRIYARVFLGPHVKSIYDMGYRSS
jgi:NADH-quinone oxidoreductase subunit L